MQPFPNAPGTGKLKIIGIMTPKDVAAFSGAAGKAKDKDSSSSLLQKMNKLQEVLQHERDQLGKGTLPRDVWGRSSKENHSKQRVQMLGRRMWLGERGGEKQ